MCQRHVAYFNDQWIDNPGFSSWIEKYTKRTNAKCRICQKIYLPWEPLLSFHMQKERNIKKHKKVTN